jgi:hypothetical protein
MGLNRFLPELVDYSIVGLIAKREGSANISENKPDRDGEWLDFECGVSYDAFLIFKSKWVN